MYVYITIPGPEIIQIRELKPVMLQCRALRETNSKSRIGPKYLFNPEQNLFH